MARKSIAKNSIIYSIKTIIGLVFPLITYPYATRVLSVASIGKVNFAASIISYFALISGLGIYTFAVREGAKIRDDQEKINRFASEVFTINIISTIFAYIFFVIMFLINQKWHDYTAILFIISITIPLTTMGVDWIFTIYEEYFYITVRTIFVQILSVFFLFLFVKSDKDVCLYAFYTVFASVGSNIFNIIRSKKYVKLKIVIDKKMVAYIKPIIILFASSVATQIYLNSDITILGYMTSDREVGLYNSAVKVYNIVKNLLLSIGTVSVPSLAYLFSLNEDDRKLYDKQFINIMKIIAFFALPCALGLASISTDVMVIFAGAQYVKSGVFLKILAFALPFSVIGSYLASGCLVIFGKERKILDAALVGALLNIILNIVFIPVFGSLVAAITTLISEIITVLIHLYNINKFYKIKNVRRSIFKSVLSSSIMFVLCLYFTSFELNRLIRVLIIVAVGVVTYIFLSIFLRNEVVIELKEFVKSKI